MCQEINTFSRKYRFRVRKCIKVNCIKIQQLQENWTSYSLDTNILISGKICVAQFKMGPGDIFLLGFYNNNFLLAIFCCTAVKRISVGRVDLLISIKYANIQFFQISMNDPSLCIPLSVNILIA